MKNYISVGKLPQKKGFTSKLKFYLLHVIEYMLITHVLTRCRCFIIDFWKVHYIEFFIHSLANTMSNFYSNKMNKPRWLQSV